MLSKISESYRLFAFVIICSIAGLSFASLNLFLLEKGNDFYGFIYLFSLIGICYTVFAVPASFVLCRKNRTK